MGTGGSTLIMHYGHAKHTPSENDLTIYDCDRCGWTAPFNKAERLARGVPTTCDKCGGYAPRFITYHPIELDEVRALIGRDIPER